MLGLRGARGGEKKGERRGEEMGEEGRGGEDWGVDLPHLLRGVRRH